MGSISIAAARAIYGGQTVEETARNMAEAKRHDTIYAYANDYGDRHTATDLFTLEKPGDEQRLFDSPAVHNPRLVFSGARADLAVAGDSSVKVDPVLERQPWSIGRLWFSVVVAWKFDRLRFLTRAFFVLAWGCLSLWFLRDSSGNLWITLLWSATNAIGMLLVLSIFSGPIAYFAWRNVLAERRGAGWLTWSALNFAFGLLTLLFG